MLMKNRIKSILSKFYKEESSLDSEEHNLLNEFYCHFVQVNIEEVDGEGVDLKFREDLMSRFPLFGLSSAFKKFQTNEDLKDYEEKAAINFANKFTTLIYNLFLLY